MPDCEMNMRDCDGLKGVLEKMFDDPHCDLILNKAHGGQAETDAGRKLYEIVPEGCIVVEFGTPGYSNLSDAIPWVMEVFRFIHQETFCPPKWKAAWLENYPHICEFLKNQRWETEAMRRAKNMLVKAKKAAKDFIEKTEKAKAVAAVAAETAATERVAAETAAGKKVVEAAYKEARYAEKEAADEKEKMLYKFKQIIQLVLTNTRFYNEGCEIYNMSFAGSEDGITPDEDAYIYTLPAEQPDRLDDWNKNENSQFKRIGFKDYFSEVELKDWWDTKKDTVFRTATSGALRAALDAEEGDRDIKWGERWRWFGKEEGGALVSCPLEVEEEGGETSYEEDSASDDGDDYLSPDDEEDVQLVGTSNVIYLRPVEEFAYKPGQPQDVIISKESLNGEEWAEKRNFADYQSIFEKLEISNQKSTQLPKCTVIFAAACKPHREGFEKLKGFLDEDIYDPSSSTLTDKMFTLWIDLLVHNEHVFRNGKRCLQPCPLSVPVPPLSSTPIHEHISGSVIPTEIMEQAANLVAARIEKSYVNYLMAQAAADMTQEAINHHFGVARAEAIKDLPKIMEKKYKMPVGRKGEYTVVTGKDILRTRFEEGIKLLNCSNIYPCTSDYKGSLSNMIRNIKRHLHGCLCMVCGSGCPIAPLQGGGVSNIARGRIAYKRKSKRRTYKKRKSRRSRRRPNKKRKSKRKKRTRRRTKRKTRNK
jgi:hypothetical protein